MHLSWVEVEERFFLSLRYQIINNSLKFLLLRGAVSSGLLVHKALGDSAFHIALIKEGHDVQWGSVISAGLCGDD